MNIESITSRTMKYSVTASIILIIIGVIIDMMDVTDAVLYAGIGALILCPLLGVIVTTICLLIEKDRKWILVAMILIAISAINMAISVIMID